ncbi:MAG TPA: hypothetical protein G4O02_10900 [Caldilineae bacterium]|nr:hypothetical protein [Caldilineae bacterium]
MKLTQNYIIGYLLWLLSSALAVLDLIAARATVMRIATVIGLGRWVLGAIDRFGILILGVVGCAFVLFCEYYYREGVAKRRLWYRFGRVSAVEIGVLILAYIVSLIIP